MTSIAIDMGSTNLRVSRVEDGRPTRLKAEPCRTDGFAYPHEAENVKIVYSQLADSNLLGAAAL